MLGASGRRWEIDPESRLRRADAGVLAQDRPFELLQRGAGVDAELVEQRGPAVPVGLQRFGLAAGPVEGEHQLAAQPLPERVLRQERLQLA